LLTSIDANRSIASGLKNRGLYSNSLCTIQRSNSRQPVWMFADELRKGNSCHIHNTPASLSK
jgi:hypothetical protein